jgi:hypothetical protein
MNLQVPALPSAAPQKKRQTRAKQPAPPQVSPYLQIPTPPPPLPHVHKLPPDRQAVFDQLFRELARPDGAHAIGPLLTHEVSQLAESLSQDFANPQLSVFEYYAKPALPLVFRPLAGGRGGAHYFAVSPAQASPVHFEPAPAERRADAFFLGSFLHPRPPPPGPLPFAVQLDDAEVPSRRLGEKADGFFFLGGGEAGARQLRIAVRPENPRPDCGPRSWFVVQAVERKPAADVVRELCERAGYAAPAELPPALEAHTPQCRACNFNGLRMIERAQAFLDPLCPVCGKPAVLADLVWTELAPRGADDEEAPDVRAAKAKFFEHYAATVLWPMLENDWAEIIFGDAPEPEYAPEELRYASTEEFLAEMERLRPRPARAGAW